MSFFNYSIAALAILGVFAQTVSSEHLNITSPPVTDWGTWGRFERCPNGTFAQGFQLKTEKNQFLLDDTATNGVTLFCGDPFNQTTTTISSAVGTKGEWGSRYSCYPGYINGFQMRVEAYQGSGDDTATNNLRIFCSNAPDPNTYVEGDGLNYGIWGATRRCFTSQRVCGLQVQNEDCEGNSDCTSTNNVLMECCDA